MQGPCPDTASRVLGEGVQTSRPSPIMAGEGVQTSRPSPIMAGLQAPTLCIRIYSAEKDPSASSTRKADVQMSGTRLLSALSHSDPKKLSKFARSWAKEIENGTAKQRLLIIPVESHWPEPHDEDEEPTSFSEAASMEYHAEALLQCPELAVFSACVSRRDIGSYREQHYKGRDDERCVSIEMRSVDETAWGSCHWHSPDDVHHPEMDGAFYRLFNTKAIAGDNPFENRSPNSKTTGSHPDESSWRIAQFTWHITALVVMPRAEMRAHLLSRYPAVLFSLDRQVCKWDMDAGLELISADLDNRMVCSVMNERNVESLLEFACTEARSEALFCRLLSKVPEYDGLHGRCDDIVTKGIETFGWTRGIYRAVTDLMRMSHVCVETKGISRMISMVTAMRRMEVPEPVADPLMKDPVSQVSELLVDAVLDGRGGKCALGEDASVLAQFVSFIRSDCEPYLRDNAISRLQAKAEEFPAETVATLLEESLPGSDSGNGDSGKDAFTTMWELLGKSFLKVSASSPAHSAALAEKLTKSHPDIAAKIGAPLLESLRLDGPALHKDDIVKMYGFIRGLPSLHSHFTGLAAAVDRSTSGADACGALVDLCWQREILKIELPADGVVVFEALARRARGSRSLMRKYASGVVFGDKCDLGSLKVIFEQEDLGPRVWSELKSSIVATLSGEGELSLILVVDLIVDFGIEPPVEALQGDIDQLAWDKCSKVVKHLKERGAIALYKKPHSRPFVDAVVRRCVELVPSWEPVGTKYSTKKELASQFTGLHLFELLHRLRCPELMTKFIARMGATMSVEVVMKPAYLRKAGYGDPDILELMRARALAIRAQLEGVHGRSDKLAAEMQALEDKIAEGEALARKPGAVTGKRARGADQGEKARKQAVAKKSIAESTAAVGTHVEVTMDTTVTSGCDAGAATV